MSYSILQQIKRYCLKLIFWGLALNILTENQIFSVPWKFKRLFSKEFGGKGDELECWFTMAGDTCWNCCWSKSCFCNGERLSKKEVNGAPGRAVVLVRRDSAL